MSKQLIKIWTPLFNICRNKGYKHQGGIKCPGGIVYFPRYVKFYKLSNTEISYLSFSLLKLFLDIQTIKILNTHQPNFLELRGLDN